MFSWLRFFISFFQVQGYFFCHFLGFPKKYRKRGNSFGVFRAENFGTCCFCFSLDSATVNFKLKVLPSQTLLNVRQNFFALFLVKCTNFAIFFGFSGCRCRRYFGFGRLKRSESDFFFKNLNKMRIIFRKSILKN